MIPRTVATWQSQSWQEQLIDSVRNWHELLDILELSPADLAFALGREGEEGIEQAMRVFALRVPRHYLSLMRKGDPRDPLLLQVLPQAEELITASGYSLDPLQETFTEESLPQELFDNADHPLPGVIQKYRSRVLLMLTSACAVNCRYCFRRHFPYQDHQRSKEEWRQNLALIAQDANVNEIILSGGDPLSANDRLLSWLIDQINELPNITTLRIHTRFPVVIPERLDEGCREWLSRHPRLHKVMVLHCNHPREISPELKHGVQQLRHAGVHVLNQSVLLKDINDSAEILIELSNRLFAGGIMPYYLHLLDKVAGTHHFDTGEDQARALHQQMCASLPGYLVPKLVREIPGRTSKTLV
jgi:EF-P beta-lysylation protein EpmB